MHVFITASRISSESDLDEQIMKIRYKLQIIKSQSKLQPIRMNDIEM